MYQNVEVVTMGECMALVYPGEPVPLANAKYLHIDLAGAESNFAIALSRLGHSIRFISRLGDDPFGAIISRVLKKEGVVMDSVYIDKKLPTGLFFREWLPDGQRRVYYYRKGSAASVLSKKDLLPEFFNNCRVFHLTGITPALSKTCLKACEHAILLAKSLNALISFDPNYRQKLWDKKNARDVLLPLISYSDILLMGHEDALALFGIQEEQQYLIKAQELGPKICILKKAEKGVLALIENTWFEVPAYPIDHVVDPVGAGDGFNAGYIAGFLRGWDHYESLKLAVKIGALAVTQMGDYHGYPYNL